MTSAPFGSAGAPITARPLLCAQVATVTGTSASPWVARRLARPHSSGPQAVCSEPKEEGRECVSKAESDASGLVNNVQSPVPLSWHIAKPAILPVGISPHTCRLSSLPAFPSSRHGMLFAAKPVLPEHCIVATDQSHGSGAAKTDWKRWQQALLCANVKGHGAMGESSPSKRSAKPGAWLKFLGANRRPGCLVSLLAAQSFAGALRLGRAQNLCPLVSTCVDASTMPSLLRSDQLARLVVSAPRPHRAALRCNATNKSRDCPPEFHERIPKLREAPAAPGRLHESDSGPVIRTCRSPSPPPWAFQLASAHVTYRRCEMPSSSIQSSVTAMCCIPESAPLHLCHLAP
ncbi:hypothetical protein IQ07DRAFT_663497 [Pyrenochaeta sp. DS3sAY3a]|nr:hypothetical protein IQ07DRAFT_663497 [Pyrenochaeta sp. DS3sAY3a]